MIERRMFDKDDSFTLRGLCILIIIIKHLVLFYSERYGMSLPRWGIELRDVCFVFVGTFFIMSGYGIYHSVMRNRPINGHYWARRLLKLYIPFVFVVLVVSLLKQLFSHFELKELWQSLITLSLPTEELWFVKTIFVFYVVTCALLGYIRKPKIAIALITLLAILWMIIAYYKIGKMYYWWQTLWCFPAGLWFAHYHDKLKKWDKPVVWWSILAIMIASYCVYYFFRTTHAPVPLKYALKPWVCNTLSLSFALLFVKFIPKLGIRSRVINYCGRNSYLLYMGHVGLLQLFAPTTTMGVFTILVVTIAFAITAAYSWLDSLWLHKLTS